MSFLMEKETDTIKTVKLRNLKKLEKNNRKMQKLEDNVVINGKIHLLKDLILLKIGKHSD